MKQLIIKYKKYNKLVWTSLLLLFIAWSCKNDFLNNPPAGVLGDEQVSSKAGVEELLIGAYGALGGQATGTGWNASPDNWVFGSICGGDAHKGSDPSDQADAYPIERFETLPTNAYIETKWVTVMDGVVRCDNILKALTKTKDITDAEKTEIMAETQFLRAFYNFELQKMWNNVPYVDETVDYSLGNYQVPNSGPIWDKIEADLQFAYQNLPETQTEVGRANKWAAASYLAKAYMFEKKYSDALPLLNTIINQGVNSKGTKYALLPKFSDNFDVASDNSSESIFAFQAAVNTGTSGAQANFGDILNFPYNGPGNCCGFFQPSIELANSYRTDANGLPLLSGSTFTTGGAYDNSANAVKNDQGLKSTDAFTPDQGNLDPRLDHTVGRRGIPYMDWGPDPGQDWVRNQASSGPYVPIKNVYKKSQAGTFTDGSSWTPGLTAENVNLLRFAQVILWAAECEVEVGSREKARAYVNQIRTRASNTADFVKNPNGTNAAKYVIGLYNTTWSSQATARLAVHFEEKLELAMEGHRFFDLVRWNEAASTLNTYLTYEAQFTGDMKGAHFTAGKTEYFPIPQQQIDLSFVNGQATLKQNPNY